MSLTELLPEVEALSRDDKRRLMSLLEEQLADDQEQQPLKSDIVYPLFSPYDSYNAAAILLEVLRTGKDTVE